MDFPFGHHRHRREDEEDAAAYPPPPPTHHQYHHQQGPPQPYPPQPYANYQGLPPPPYPPQPYANHQGPPPPSAYLPIQHTSHDVNPGFDPYSEPGYPHPIQQQHHHHHHPHNPFHHHSRQGAGPPPLPPELFNKPTVRVFSKAQTSYSLTIRDGRVILAPSHPNDVFQHWIKEEKYSTRVKDEEGFPSFALVNKATGQAMKHSIGATHPVQLITYNPNVLDGSILWAESKDLGDGYRTIRMINNIRLNLDALNGDENHGGVHDGTIVVLWEWKKGENQRWKIAPY